MADNAEEIRKKINEGVAYARFLDESKKRPVIKYGPLHFDINQALEDDVQALRQVFLELHERWADNPILTAQVINEALKVDCLIGSSLRDCLFMLNGKR